jgi:hypothetical protein
MNFELIFIILNFELLALFFMPDIILVITFVSADILCVMFAWLG